MFYSLTILLIGIYLGQELNLPRIKHTFNLYKEQPIEQSIDLNIKTNYFTRFVNFIYYKQKNQN